MLNGLDGFGTSAPIFVRFEAPLDLDTVTDQSVLVVNVEPGHPREGEQAVLDLGHGYFPLALEEPTSYWGHDPHAAAADFVLPDQNQVGLARVTHYEVMSHTLILRPATPLAASARHAVLILRDVMGEATGPDGEASFSPVRSPFPMKAHVAQGALVRDAMALVGLPLDQLAFGWTFTTTEVTRPLTQIRRGLLGEGPLARLGEGFPPVFEPFRSATVTHDGDGVHQPFDPRDHLYIVQSELLNDLLALVGQAEPLLNVTLEHVDYLAFGSVRTPGIRTGEMKTLGLDTETGAGVVGEELVPIAVAVPRTTLLHGPPFPVVLHFHGTETSRLEMVFLADALAEQGIAMVAFDQVAHGPLIPNIPLLLEEGGLDPSLVSLMAPILAELLAPDRVAEFDGLAPEEALKRFNEIGFFAEFAVVGRAEDLNGDGLANSGEAFFFGDPFRQCANIFQNTVDAMQIVRVLSALDQAAIGPALADPRTASDGDLQARMRAGDFNADGVLDIGGPGVPIGLCGMSLGGLQLAIEAAVDPTVSTVTPIVAGGGISNIIMRSRLRKVISRLALDIFGPLVVGCPDGDGGVWLSFNDDADGCNPARLEEVSFGHVSGVPAAARVTLKNLANGEAKSTELDPQGGFSLGVESDRWDQLELTIPRAGGEPARILAQTPYEGLAFERNTPEFRRFLGLSAHVADRCDALNFAPRLFLDPLPGHPPKSVLMLNAIGDWTVPISTGIDLARAAGILGRTPQEWRPVMQGLVGAGIVNGVHYDVDDVLGDNPPETPALGPFPAVSTGAGVAAIRFAAVGGNHEWIAFSDPGAALDKGRYARYQLALFHAEEGARVSDGLCILDSSCPEE
jgi:hypothetical protein